MINLNNCKRVLAFFAHPDDETLAAGATITKLVKSGVEVSVAIPATGIYSRRNKISDSEMEVALKELKKDTSDALAVLGVKNKNLYFGTFSDNEMDKHTLLEVIHWLESIIEKVKPDVILTHHRYCTNIDHQYCHEAAVIATRPAINSHITVICGEVPSSTGYLKPAQWEPNFFVEVDEIEVDTKIRAMQTFKDEARPDPHPRSPEVIKAIAKVRGSESGFYFAEAFMIQKLFG